LESVLIIRNQNLTNRINEAVLNKSEYKLFGKVVFVKDPLPDHVFLIDVVSKIESLIPKYLFHDVGVIYIGDFDIFEKKKINALYLDGAIYLSNKQDSNNDMVDDIIHELAHSLEEQYGKDIYADNQIRKEFLLKRRWLERNLRHQGFNTTMYDFDKTEYDIALDNFFLKDVGYQYLNAQFSGRAFINAYAVTSLREYFATGFEEYYLGDRVNLLRLCPNLYQKLEDIDSMED